MRDEAIGFINTLSPGRSYEIEKFLGIAGMGGIP
jgi:hypothetical protein